MLSFVNVVKFSGSLRAFKDLLTFSWVDYERSKDIHKKRGRIEGDRL